MIDTLQESGIGLSIIIVNYNSGELLKNCITSLLTNINVSFEIIVYDNASQDDSIACLHELRSIYPEIKIIKGPLNLGFAKANNLAAAQANGIFYHFLNPDIVVNQSLNDVYKKILTAGDHAIWVTDLTDEQGNLQKNKHLVPRIGNLLKHMFGYSDVAYWNIGASIIIHKDAYAAMAGWPDDYFMYAEDLDFFYTAFRHKIPVNYLNIALMHIGKGVTHKIWSDEQRATIIEKSFRRFYRKYGAGWEYLLIRPVLLSYMLFKEPASFPLYAKVFLKTLFKA
jgi:GT2 family glycosyltransferase